MIRKAKFRMMLMVLMLGSIFGCRRSEETQMIRFNGFEKLFLKVIKTDPDKNLLIGEWEVTGTPYFFKITGVSEIGRLEIAFYNPNNPYKIEIEKANWSKLGTLLSIYIELQHPEFPGSNFKLNYIPERDVLVGVYYDSMTGVSYPLEFVRIR